VFDKQQEWEREKSNNKKVKRKWFLASQSEWSIDFKGVGKEKRFALCFCVVQLTRLFNERKDENLFGLGIPREREEAPLLD